MEEIWYKMKLKVGVRERFCYVIRCMGNERLKGLLIWMNG
jgi:hypothetical protein